MQTEQQNPQTHNLDQMNATAILRLMNAEDQRVPQAVEAVIPQIARAVEVVRTQLMMDGRLFYVGAGTSGRLGVLDAVECVPTFGTEPHTVQGIIAGGDGAFVQAVEGAEDERQAGADDLQARSLTASDVVVGIAASGHTPYVLGAIDYAKQVGAPTIGIACNKPAPLLTAANLPIGVIVGAEVLTGSTRLKAGTAQKLVLNMISTASFALSGKVYGNLMVDVQVTNDKLKRRAQSIISTITGTDAETARDLLSAADNDVKVAIVMHLRDVDAATARQLLHTARGYLRDVLTG
jgi:N-acetylmuramic acid 6-phosphate etherase